MATNLPPCSLGQEPKVAVYRSDSLLRPKATLMNTHLALRAGAKATLPKVLRLSYVLS